MAVRVVDALEVIAVQVQDTVLLLTSAGGHTLHPLAEEVAIGQRGQRVVQGLMGQLLLELMSVADIVHVEDHPANCRVIHAVGELDPQMAPFAIPAEQPRLDLGRRPSPTGHGPSPCLRCVVAIVRVDQPVEGLDTLAVGEE